jgi:hypothetical protein
MRSIGAVLTFALLVPPALPAQVDSVGPRLGGRGGAPRDGHGSALVHYGKWVAAAGAATLIALGAHEHANSNREWSALLAICRANNADCALGPNGRYANPTAEQLYQSSLFFDRRARARLLGGQAALLVAAGLFIADLRHRGGGPGNVQFAPLEVLGDVGAGGARVGVRVSF